MKKDNVVELIQPGEFKDQLTEVLRQGAQAIVLQVVEAEFSVFLDSHSEKKLRMVASALYDTGICQSRRW